MESRLIGRIIRRRFRVEEVIGRGGMAIVYRAFDLRTHQTVALKVLREEYENDPEYKERFRREADVCRKLNHPNVVNMIDAGTVGGISFIAIEYVDGKTLKELIGECGKIPQEIAVRYAIQILEGLGHAHQKGIVHRDVKPQNVLITRTGQLKISDFGIAGMADTQTITSDGNVIGSVHYFSPEQAKGMKATASSDLYSVGVILYEMLAGHVPFDGETAVSVAMMHLMETPEPIEQQADVSHAVALVLEKALHKQPQERYQSAESMIRDLRRALRHPDGLFMEQSSSSDNTVKKKQPEGTHRHKKAKNSIVSALIALFLALLLFVLIVVAGLRVYRSMFLVARVPDLSGLEEGDAVRMVQSAGLVPRFAYAYSSLAEGFVCEQEPEANAELARGSTVLVTISRGSGQLVVQRFTGMTQSDAETAIAEQGFSLGEVKVILSEQRRGTVIEQTPSAGESARIGSPISLTVSGGRVVMPELTGVREEEALEQIKALDLTQGLITYEPVEDERLDGIVLAQEPEKFAQVLPQSEVELSVGYYDKRRYTASVRIEEKVPEQGLTVRVTLVEPDGREQEMYEATYEEPGEIAFDVLLRSETSGVMTWRLYLDGNFSKEATAVLQ